MRSSPSSEWNFICNSIFSIPFLNFHLLNSHPQILAHCKRFRNGSSEWPRAVGVLSSRLRRSPNGHSNTVCKPKYNQNLSSGLTTRKWVFSHLMLFHWKKTKMNEFVGTVSFSLFNRNRNLLSIYHVENEYQIIYHCVKPSSSQSNIHCVYTLYLTTISHMEPYEIQSIYLIFPLFVCERNFSWKIHHLTETHHK